jgi:hypothetical protein
MPNENELIAEYEKHREAAERIDNKIFADAVADLASMRDDVDPRAVAAHWWQEMHDRLSPNEVDALLKSLALQALEQRAKEIIKTIPTCADVGEPHEYAPGEEEELREAVAAGARVCYKGGEMYGNV